MGSRAAISEFDPSWFCRCWMAESCGACSSFSLPFPAPSVNPTCRLCNRSVARSRPRVREAIEGGSTTLGLEAFSQPPANDPGAANRPSPKLLDRVGAGAGYSRSPGLPNRRSDGGSSGAGCVSGLDGGPRGLDHGRQSGADPDSHDAGRGAGYNAGDARSQPAPPAPGGTGGYSDNRCSQTCPAGRSQADSKPKTPTSTPLELNGGLVVYEHGKVVFRMGPSEKEVSSEGCIRCRGIDSDSKSGDTGRRRLAPAPAPSANSYLLERVEPQYPEAARQQHIQGPVVLNVLVGPTAWFGKPA